MALIREMLAAEGSGMSCMCPFCQVFMVLEREILKGIHIFYFIYFFFLGGVLGFWV